MPRGKALDEEIFSPVIEKSGPKESTPSNSLQSTVPMPVEKTVAEEISTPVIEKSTPQESPKLSYRDALKKGSGQDQKTSRTPDHSPRFVSLMPRRKTLAKESHPPATSSRPRKSYEQRKEEYAQARLRILGSRSDQKESPKGSWMKRVRNYIHGTRKKEPP